VTSTRIGEIVTPDAAGLRRAAELLHAHSVVAFPTETVYGLGANALSRKAIDEVYRLKNRPTSNPLIVHVPHVESARSLTRSWPSIANELAASFWPGPLTLVLPRNRRLTSAGTAGDTVAIRVPAHEVALRLLEAAQLPLAAPSANRSERISPTTAQHVARGLPDVPLVLDGGPSARGIESTVLDLTTAVPTLLRPGALPLREIREVIGEIALPHEGTARNSPGMSRRHYAPRAKLILVPDVREASRDDLAEPVAVLTYEGAGMPGAEVLSGDPQEYAADLYAALHRMDDDGVGTILVQEPPKHEDWLAVRDRLVRAAEPIALDRASAAES
jgi:L-threonylcarbamoyladenylate synthase